MFNIICSHCGQSVLPINATFDLSDYITQLYMADNDSINMKLKYYVKIADINITESCKDYNDTNLKFDLIKHHAGPESSDDYFKYVFTNDMLIDYIARKINTDRNTIYNIISQEARRGSYTDDQNRIIRDVFEKCFYTKQEEASYIDGNEISADCKRQIMAILVEIFEYTGKKVEVKLSFGCKTDKHGIDIPMVLFVLDGVTAKQEKRKCDNCRCAFPQEFGFYKIVPVTLLGSQGTGKTTFLFSMMYAILNKSPFIDDNKLSIQSLVEDSEKEWIDEGYKVFKKGGVPNKTDFTDVPSFSWLINDVIYTFSDWPGEAFLNDENSMDFAFNSKKSVFKSPHILLFLNPDQIDPDLETEGHECIPWSKIYDRFKAHILPQSELTSITIIINKSDVFFDDPHYRDFTEQLQKIVGNEVVREGHLYTETKGTGKDLLNKEKVDEINRFARNFLNRHGIQGSVIEKTYENTKQINYIPVAPLGVEGSEFTTGKHMVDKSVLSGLPLLLILATDGILGYQQKKQQRAPEAQATQGNETVN